MGFNKRYEREKIQEGLVDIPISDYCENLTVLIDADGIPYKAAHKAETSGKSLDEAYEIVDMMFLSILKNANSNNYIAFVTGKDNFRKKLRVDYKQARLKYKDQQQKQYYNELKLYMYERWKCVRINGAEADDACGIMSTRLMHDCIIASDDLDLLQLEGLHYRISNRQFMYITDSIGSIYIEQKEYSASKVKKLRGYGKKLFWAMMLMGDKDEIQGPKGYGSVKTYNSLIDCNTEEELKAKVIECYKQEYADDFQEKFDLNYKLLFLLRDNKNFITPVTNYVNT